MVKKSYFYHSSSSTPLSPDYHEYLFLSPMSLLFLGNLSTKSCTLSFFLSLCAYDQGMGNRGEVFMTWEGFEPGTWSLELLKEGFGGKIKEEIKRNKLQ